MSESLDVSTGILVIVWADSVTEASLRTIGSLECLMAASRPGENVGSSFSPNRKVIKKLNDLQRTYGDVWKGLLLDRSAP